MGEKGSELELCGVGAEVITVAVADAGGGAGSGALCSQIMPSARTRSTVAFLTDPGTPIVLLLREGRYGSWARLGESSPSFLFRDSPWR